MKAILFCYNPYAFGILKPLHNQLEAENHSVLWYLRPGLESKFPYKDLVKWTNRIKDLADFNSDAIFVPGNEVPHYLRGVKVQVFHGLAGEKKGHFRIRHYFDLYLTQGPYFTEGFLKLKNKYLDFEVVETGWPKLDLLFSLQDKYVQEKKALLNQYQAQKVILYAPTFSPSLTSAPFVIDEIDAIANHPDFMVLIKFHDLMANELKQQYQEKFSNHPGVRFASDDNIIKYLIMSDLMISDTSSVVYEFMLLDKPVVTIRSSSNNIIWNNITDSTSLTKEVFQTFEKDAFALERKKIIARYHPYTDGKSSERMIQAVENYIREHGIPEKRDLSLYRLWKIRKMFGFLK